MYGIKMLEHGIQSHSSLHAVLGCRFTGGQLQDSRPWGTGGVWLEPYDEERAKASKKRLFDAWHQSPAELTQRAQAGPDGNASDTEANTGPPLCYLGPWAAHGTTYLHHDIQFRRHHNRRRTCLLLAAEPPAPANAVCGHTACSAVAVCIVKELEETKRLYRSRTDQFRIKAVEVTACHCHY